MKILISFLQLPCITSRPGSGPRREGRPPRAHGLGGPKIKYVYSPPIHIRRGPAGYRDSIARLGSRHGKELTSHVRRLVASLQTSHLPFFAVAAACPPSRRPATSSSVHGVFRLVSRDRLLLACPCTSDSSPLPQQHFAISNNQQQIGE